VLLWLNLATNFSVLPLRLAIVAGVAMGFLGILGALLVIVEALIGVTPSGWASMMTVTLLIAGVQFLILGVLGEYVGRAFLSANGKPQGVVREARGPAARDATAPAARTPSYPQVAE
jgi:undecaprenyl-phosphate 4-deoxy-4-formamido-L-arabinose transferase